MSLLNVNQSVAQKECVWLHGLQRCIADLPGLDSQTCVQRQLITSLAVLVGMVKARAERWAHGTQCLLFAYLEGGTRKTSPAV